MINNRQAGRRRGRGGQQQRPQGNTGRQDNGNRIDNRARGNAAQLLEKYKTLARDAQMQGDRVNTEYYLQFADHYFRVLAETRSRFEENRRQNGGAAYEEDEQEYDDDGEPIVREPVAREPRQANGNGNGQDRGQDRNQDRGPSQGYRQNEGQNGNQASQYDDERPRSRGNGNGGNNGNGYGDGGTERAARDDRGDRNGTERAERPAREDRSGNERPDRNDRTAARGEDRGNRAPARRAVETEEAAPVVEQAAPAQEVAAEAPAERPRRGRPRRVVQEEPAELFEADRLPPSLSISAVVADEPEEKPKRRRGRPPVTETTPAS
ncbi:MAG: DUF4167 domain-containing protein [Pseudomonadota bacterium]